MNHLRHIVTAPISAGLAAVLLGVAAPSSAQDLLASQAPIDRHLRKIDSLSLQKLIETEDFDDPAESLYNEWRNDHVKQYAGQPRPSNYKIDLRHFHMPVRSRQVTSHFGYRSRFRRMHYGLDIGLHVGDTIYAAFSGKVRVVADQGHRKGYGKYVIVRHTNGLETVYGHLSRHLVRPDQVVRAGQPIALGGNTRRSTGPHLHFETLLLGDAIDPSDLFDFVNQDVKGDFYVYQGHNRGYIANADRGESRRELAARGAKENWTPTAEDIAAAERAAAKSRESRAFQKERMAHHRSQISKVRAGDTLIKIASTYNNPEDKLCGLNHMKSRTPLKPGQIIKVS